MKRKITTTIHLDRPEGEVTVTVDGIFYPATLGTKAHPMDRFAGPDDQEEVEILRTHANGQEIELTESEEKIAEERLMEAACE